MHQIPVRTADVRATQADRLFLVVLWGLLAMSSAVHFKFSG